MSAGNPSRPNQLDHPSWFRETSAAQGLVYPEEIPQDHIWLIITS